MAARKDNKRFGVYGGVDPRNLPAYTVPMASQYLRVPQQTLRSWIFGRDYATGSGTKRSPAVIQPSSKLGHLSFWNLAEAFVLAAIRRQHGVPLPKIRKALRFVETELKVSRPLIHQIFQTDGVDLFVDHFDKLLNVSKSGQIAIKQALAARLERIEFDESGLAAKLFPYALKDETRRALEIDPTRGFGKPLICGTLITAEAVLDRFQGGESTRDLAKDYRIDQTLIEDAIRSALPQAA